MNFLFGSIVALYILGAAGIFFLCLGGIAFEVACRATGDTFFGPSELSVVKKGLLFFWAWPLMALPHVIDIFKESGENNR